MIATSCPEPVAFPLTNRSIYSFIETLWAKCAQNVLKCAFLQHLIQSILWMFESFTQLLDILSWRDCGCTCDNGIDLIMSGSVRPRQRGPIWWQLPYAFWTSCRQILKPRDSSLDFSKQSKTRHVHRQQRCHDTCRILERCYHYNSQSRGFEISRDLAVRRLTA